MFYRGFSKIPCNFWRTSILYINESAEQPVPSTGEAMSNSSPERNKAIVLEAFETLFNKRDYTAAERFWSPNYIQHSAHIAPGREGLFNLVRSAPETLHYENQLIIAEGDYVIAHGCFTRDVGDYAARRLLHLDFSGKQTRELLGERDLSMTE